MYDAVEFQTIVNEDGTIVVPKEYLEKIGERVRVILLPNPLGFSEEEIPAFDEISISTKDFKFCREEANER